MERESGGRTLEFSNLLDRQRVAPLNQTPPLTINGRYLTINQLFPARRAAVDGQHVRSSPRIGLVKL